MGVGVFPFVDSVCIFYFSRRQLDAVLLLLLGHYEDIFRVDGCNRVRYTHTRRMRNILFSRHFVCQVISAGQGGQSAEGRAKRQSKAIW